MTDFLFHKWSIIDILGHSLAIQQMCQRRVNCKQIMSFQIFKVLPHIPITIANRKMGLKILCSCIGIQIWTSTLKKNIFSAFTQNECFEKYWWNHGCWKIHIRIQKDFVSVVVLIQLTSLCRWNYNSVCHIGYDQFCNGPNASKPIIIILKLQLKSSLFHKIIRYGLKTLQKVLNFNLKL